MTTRRLVMDIAGPPGDDVRLAETLDLAAGLAAFGHDVCLVVDCPALAYLARAAPGGELKAQLDLLAELGVDVATTGNDDLPASLRRLAVRAADIEATRAEAEAVLTCRTP